MRSDISAVPHVRIEGLKERPCPKADGPGLSLGLTYHIASLCILLDIRHSLLLLSFQLALLPLEFPLSFLEGTLMLTQALSRRQALAE